MPDIIDYGSLKLGDTTGQYRVAKTRLSRWHKHFHGTTSPMMELGDRSVLPVGENDIASQLRPETPEQLLRAYRLEDDWTKLQTLIHTFLGDTATLSSRIKRTWETDDDQLVVDVDYSPDIPRDAFFAFLREFVHQTSIEAQRRITVSAFPK